MGVAGFGVATPPLSPGTFAAVISPAPNIIHAEKTATFNKTVLIFMILQVLIFYVTKVIHPPGIGNFKAELLLSFREIEIIRLVFSIFA